MEEVVMSRSFIIFLLSASGRETTFELENRHQRLGFALQFACDVMRLGRPVLRRTSANAHCCGATPPSSPGGGLASHSGMIHPESFLTRRLI